MNGKHARPAHRIASLAVALTAALAFTAGSVASATPATASGTPLAAQSLSANAQPAAQARYRWVTLGQVYCYPQCVAYGNYWVASGQIINYQCIRFDVWGRSFMRVLVRY
ncbi:hypothetical protein ACFV7Q_30890 [Streptomyces sp. NPDC059851]|uniref:hypothetical protein n=1 Tax=Streptomyces sp. NPDC059851 TaxID=3346971 RepID=UPI0036530DB1